MSNIWIKLTFNTYNLLQGKEELVEELRKECVVQEKQLWYPAACTGTEFLAEILINSPLSEFINDIVIPGIAWDLLKTSIKNIVKSFAAFIEKNREFDLQELKFTFNDIVLTINDVDSNNYGNLLKLYKNLPAHLKTLNKLNIKDIIEIELPFVESKETDEFGNKEYYYPPLDTPETDFLWKITYNYGLDTCFYNPAKEIIF